MLVIAGVLLLAASSTAQAQGQTFSTGAALSFDGTDDHVSVPLLSPLASNYTLSAWVYLRAGGQINGVRMAVLSSSTCGGSVELLIRSITEDTGDPQYLELGRCGYFNGDSSTATVPLNSWTHLAVTVGGNKTVSYYVNGNQAGVWSAAGTDVGLGSTIHLGDNISRKFNGMLDEVQIWSTTLTQAEIQTNMNRRLAGDEPGLHAYFPMDEAGGGVVADAAAAGGVATGTLNNGVAWTNAAIMIPAIGPADRYPSQVMVSGVTNSVASIAVTLTGFEHTYPSDVNVLLVNPSGQNIMLMSGVSSDMSVTNLTLRFDDAATAHLPAGGGGGLVSGTFRPTDYFPGDSFPAPAPAGPYTTTNLAALKAGATNGIWSLYMEDISSGDQGSLQSWSITFYPPAPTNAGGSTLLVSPAGLHQAPYSTWATAATNIQTAIDFATAGDTVLVGDGVYQTGGRNAPGSSLTNRVVIDKAITVRSVNGPSATAIRGNGPNGNAAVRCAWIANGAKLVGFTLTNGATRTSGDVFLDQSGGAIWAESATAVASNCVLAGSAAAQYGGGAFGGTLDLCTLAGNQALFGGGVAYSGNTGTLNQCRLTGNVSTSQGGGAFGDGTLNYCTLTGNSSDIGGGSIGGTLNNCILSGNSATSLGGGAAVGTLNNCTVTSNSAATGGGVHGGTYNNCIVYFNDTGGNHVDGTFRHTCTTPLPAGTGNITNNPLFNPTNEFRLAVGSPCIDAGSNAYVSGATDIDGQPRIAYGTVDMGADEALPPGTRYVRPGNATPVYPYASWAQAATNIQDAVDAALAGDTVLVSNGVYQTGGRVAAGSALTNRVVIDKAITVRSVNGPAVTTIRGAGPNGDAAVRCVWMTSGATLDGFTLTNGATRSSGDFTSERSGGGLLGATNGLAVVSNCYVVGNAAAGGGGGVSGASLNNCLIAGNQGGSGGGASGATLNNCTVSGNASLNFGGGVDGSTLNNCIVYFNTASQGPNHFNSTNNYTCTTPDPGGGIGNITNDPQFVNAAAGNVRLALGSPCINRGSTSVAPGSLDLDGNPRIAFSAVDLGAYEFPTSLMPTGLTHHVALGNPSAAFPYTNWTTAAASIQDAIDAAVPGNTILVSNGVYQTGGRVAAGSALTNRVVIDKPVTVRSVNGPAVTTISGRKILGDAAVRCVWMTNGANLVGFSLTNGKTRISGDTLTEQSGGGLWAQSASAVVSNCIVTGNAGQYGGGANFGTLNNCVLIGNAATHTGGGAQQSVLNNCALTGNTATVNGSSSGGGACQGTLNNCALSGNSANDYGGGAYQGTLNNCTLTGNSAFSRGGGAYQSTLNNCTLSGNNSGIQGGGALDSTLNNCILYFNSPANHDSCTINYTCTTPDPGGGIGNITNDPQFVNAGAGNYRLLPTSPCRDAGSDGLVVGATDLDGNARVFGARVDMGAHEFTPGLRYVNIGNPTPVAPYTNWATAATNIQDAVDVSATEDVVLVSNGVYAAGGRTAPGSALTNRVVIDRIVTVRSVNGPAFTTIRGSGPNGDAAVRCVWMTNGATLVGFTLTNGATRTSGDATTEQSGGGLWAASNGTAAVSNCIVTGNAGQYGGGACFGTLNNCTLIGNAATLTGGGAQQSVLNNCTLTGNSATLGGGVSDGQLNNCIVYFNQAVSDPNHLGGTLQFTCTSPLPGGGTGNLTNQPQFVNAGAGNVRLALGSPCINRGNNGLAPGSPDLDGNPRIAFSIVDMGAFELPQAMVATGSTHYVAMGNPSAAFPYTNWTTAAATIQDAIDAAVPGNTVLVSNGVYQAGGRVAAGSALTNRVLIDKPVTVRSVNGHAVTAIRGAGPSGDAAVRCVWMTNGATLAGFTLTNGATRTAGDQVTEQRGGGVWAPSNGTAIVSNGVLTGNSANSDGGGSFGGTLNQCLLAGNTALRGGGASDGTLNNCTMSGNTVVFGGAGSARCTLNNSIVYHNATINPGGNCLDCTINYTCTTPLPGGGAGNIASDPQFVNAGAGNYRLSPTSPCINAGSNGLVVGATDLDGNPRIIGARVDLGAYEYLPATHYVNMANPTPVAPYISWATAATNIQDAIDSAADSDTVLVSNGIYQTGGRVAPGSLLTNRVVIDKVVTVRSVNGPAFTILRGAGPNGDAAVRCVWITNGATLVGFTLTNGATRSSGDTVTERSGGGLWALSTAAVVSNCLVAGNTAGNSGGGAYLGTLINCALIGNSALLTGGGAQQSQLNNCTLVGNSATSGGGVSDGQLNNSVSYFNLATVNANYANGTLNHACTTPLPGGGTGNITNDPQFVSLSTTSLQLAASSPCINLGNNAFAPGPNDLAGNPRIVNTVVDMGAYEFQGVADPDYDHDGWGNAEEYIADTQPTNGASFFPRATVTNAPAGRMALVIGATSPGRVYGVYANTNLLQAPQAWILVPPEQTGTAGAITLTITNTLPGANYRTGVRMP